MLPRRKVKEVSHEWEQLNKMLSCKRAAFTSHGLGCRPSCKRGQDESQKMHGQTKEQAAVDAKV